MKQDGQFLLFSREEFRDWLFNTTINRHILLVQNHHTYSPDYRQFDSKNGNHFKLLKGMQHYHVMEAKMSDIAQNLTTFPDGLIAVCRSLEKDPAGIKGANTGGICIEHIGNFDTGKDKMTDEHQKTVIYLNMLLCAKFNLSPNTNTIVYHHWYDLDTGKRTDGSGNVKTCPGTAFFGGNKVWDAQQKFIPLIIDMLKQFKQNNPG